MVSERTAQRMFRAAVKESGSYTELARQIGISDETVAAIGRGKRPLTRSILRHLGLERVISYRRIGDRP